MAANDVPGAICCQSPRTRANGAPVAQEFPNIPTVRHLFISDLHLDASSPGTVELFLYFAQTAVGATSLHVLGDLFETWIGDDDPDPVRARICDALRGLVESGVSLHVMQGNRDFLYGPDFERRTGCTLLADPSVVTLNGERVLLTHGDLLCTGDHAYQELRTTMRDPRFRRRVLALPIEARQQLAQAARAGSKAHIRAATRQSAAASQSVAASKSAAGSATPTGPDIMDVDPAAVIAAFEASGTRKMIHGHTHRPANHRYLLGSATAERVVLAAWDETGEFLEVTPAGWARRTIVVDCAGPANPSGT